MLRIRGRWVTSKIKKHLYNARRTGPARTYMLEKYEWSDEVFDSINWTSIGNVRRKLTYVRRMQTSKIMHGWLPIMHMRQHITGISQCPGCRCEDETLEHFIKCPHHLMKMKRKEIIAALRKKGLGNWVPKSIVHAFCELLNHFFNSDTDFVTPPTFKPSLCAAIQQQQKIGINFMIHGFFATSWILAIEDHDCSKPERAMTALQRFVWNGIVAPLWTVRNEILHRKKNHFDAVEEERMAERIIWYGQNKHHVLDANDHFLARFDLTSLRGMARAAKREWVRHLDAAKAAFEIERSHRANLQNSIDQYMVVRPR